MLERLITLGSILLVDGWDVSSWSTHTSFARFVCDETGVCIDDRCLCCLLLGWVCLNIVSGVSSFLCHVVVFVYIVCTEIVVVHVVSIIRRCSICYRGTSLPVLYWSFWFWLFPSVKAWFLVLFLSLWLKVDRWLFVVMAVLPLTTAA